MQHAYSMKDITPSVSIMWCSPDQSHYLSVYGDMRRFAQYYGLVHFEKGFAPNGNPSQNVVVVEDFNEAPTKSARKQNNAAIRTAAAVALSQSADMIILRGPHAEVTISQKEIKGLATQNAALVEGTPSPDKKDLNRLARKFFTVNPQVPQPR